MSFENGFARMYTLGSVQTHAPAVSGVYGLSNARQWVYIGESDNIKASLLGHLQETGTPLARLDPTGYSFEVVPAYNRQARQHRLISELAPVLTRP